MSKELEQLIQIRNKLSAIFNSSKETWGSKKVHKLCVVMGNLDTAISNLTDYESDCKEVR